MVLLSTTFLPYVHKDGGLCRTTKFRRCGSSGANGRQALKHGIKPGTHCQVPGPSLCWSHCSQATDDTGFRISDFRHVKALNQSASLPGPGQREGYSGLLLVQMPEIGLFRGGSRHMAVDPPPVSPQRRSTSSCGPILFDASCIPTHQKRKKKKNTPVSR